MNRTRVLVSESLRSLTANLSTTVAATMTVLIGMFLLGLFIALGTWVLSWTDHAKEKLDVKVYFCTPLTCEQTGEATQAQIEATRVRLFGLPNVEDVRFVSKKEALAIMQRRRPDLVENIPSNPLPNSFTVTPKDADGVLALSSRIRAAGFPGVQEVRDGEKVANRILEVAGLISAIVGIAVLILVVAATLLIANTIRLSIFSRRREVEVMKLVGATNWFVRGPFMIEGLVCGLLGSGVAVLLLLLGKAAVASQFDRFGSDVEAIGFAWNAAILLAVGLLLGAAGSGLTLRRFLRI